MFVSLNVTGEIKSAEGTAHHNVQFTVFRLNERQQSIPKCPGRLYQPPLASVSHPTSGHSTIHEH